MTVSHEFSHSYFMLLSPTIKILNTEYFKIIFTESYNPITKTHNTFYPITLEKNVPCVYIYSYTLTPVATARKNHGGSCPGCIPTKRMSKRRYCIKE
jgi:hypothetical protein